MAEEEKPKPVDKYGWLTRPLEFVLKWGLLGLVILALITLADYIGYTVSVTKIFGQEISITEKVTERVESNDEQLANVEARVRQLTDNLARLSEDLTEQQGVTTVSPAAIRELPSQQGAVTEPLVPAEPVLGQGVIWLGEWDADAQVWADGVIDGLPDLPAPDDLVGQALTLATRVNVREDFPAPARDGYYGTVATKGVAADNSTVTILERPRSYEFENGVQYWARVETQFVPKTAALIP
ncbi:MAG: hypothetical protein AAFQ66_19510 [Pseudomonadota bacterium]